ncbi:MAG: photosynthetic complex assembly protein PuhC [Hyphomicrobium sp.]
MNEQVAEQTFPTGALVAALFMILIAIAFALTARLTDVGATRLTLPEPVETLSIRFADLAGGSIGITEADTGRQIQVLAPGEAGFVRVVMRGLAMERMASGLGPETPFNLSRLADGRSVIDDPATGRVVTLDAFGAGNAQTFAAILDRGRKLP